MTLVYFYDRIDNNFERGIFMISINVFIGSESNGRSLPLFKMEKPFLDENECYNVELVGYSINDNMTSMSSIYSEEILAYFKEYIDKSDIVLLDLTYEDIDKTSSYSVFNLFTYAINNSKKIIIVHRDNPIYQSFYDKLKMKYPNIIGMFSHNGDNLPLEVIPFINSMYRNNPKYQRRNLIEVETPEIREIVENWFKERCLTLGSGSFYHIYYYKTKILINYEGYNTIPLLSLTIGINKLSDRDKLKVFSIIEEMFDGQMNVFIHHNTIQNDFAYNSDNGVGRK